MSKAKELRTRPELQEAVEVTKHEFDEADEEMETIVHDVELVAEVKEKLRRQETVEGLEEVETGINDARDAAVEDFDRQSEELDGKQEEGREMAEDFGVRSEATEEDIHDLQSASSEVTYKPSLQELKAAEGAAEEDKEFTTELKEEVTTATDVSDQGQEGHQQRVSAKRG